MVVKATTAEIVNHWVLAVSCILLIITGYGFLFKIEGIYALFGSNATMKVVHNWTGVIFTISLAGTLFNYLGESLDLARTTGIGSRWAAATCRRKPCQCLPWARSTPDRSSITSRSWSAVSA